MCKLSWQECQLLQFLLTIYTVEDLANIALSLSHTDTMKMILKRICGFLSWGFIICLLSHSSHLHGQRHTRVSFAFFYTPTNFFLPNQQYLHPCHTLLTPKIYSNMIVANYSKTKMELSEIPMKSLHWVSQTYKEPLHKIELKYGRHFKNVVILYLFCLYTNL